MKSKTRNRKQKRPAAVGCIRLLGTVDPRVAFLREGETDVLVALLKEIAEPFGLGCSRNFFMLGMDPRFRKTHLHELFDLIAGVLRERVPNADSSPIRAGSGRRA